MTSKVSICNLALANIAASGIQDINEATAEARACRLFYDQVLGSLLEAYPWRFAQRTVAMAEVTNTKPLKWRKAFRRPSDCRKVLMVTDEAMADYIPGLPMGIPYAIEGDTIHCDLDVAYLVYTAAQTDPTKFTALFVEALAWQLAVRLSMPLTRDPKVRADAYQLAERMTTAAAVADANEQRETTDTPARILEARA